MRPDKKHFFYFLVIISLVFYLLNIYPTITNGDAGEFLSEANVLGIAHPPGYPVYIILLKLFMSLLPFTPALSGNILSALFASLTIGFLYLNLYYFSLLFLPGLKQKKNSAVITALLLSITPVFFSQAIITEVYTLNAFFLLLINFIFLKYIKTLNSKYLSLFFFIYGISLTNHITPIIFLPLYILILLKRKEKIKPGYIIYFLSGISLYFFLIIRAHASEINWAQPDSSLKLFNHITRAEYKNMNLVPNRNFLYFLKQILHYFILLFKQFYLFLIPAVSGFIYLQKINKKINILLLLFYVMSSLFFIYYLNTRLDAHIIYTARVFYIPSFIIMIFWIFTGLLYIFNRLKFSLYITINLIITQTLVTNSSQNKNYTAFDFSNNILKTVTYKSALFTVEGDNPLFALAYLNTVEYKRPDIDYCNRYGKLFKSSAAYFKTLTSISNKDLFFTSPEKLEPQLMQYMKQTGIIYKLAFKPIDNIFTYYYQLNTGDNPTDYMDKGLAAIYYFRLAYHYKINLKENKIFFTLIKKAEIFGNELEDIMKNIGDIYFKEKRFNEAQKCYENIIKINPYNSKAYFYIGLCEMNKNNYYVASSYFKKAYKNKLRTLNFLKVYSYTLFKLNNVYEALKYLNEAEELYPNDNTIKSMIRRYSEDE